ncbi:MAG: dihydroorotate dehydrogenase electron transfer subunit [Thermoplasmatota archaeon]
MPFQMEVLPVVEVVNESSMISSIIVQPDDSRRWLSMMPGQFIMVWIPGVDEVPMSVSSVGGDPIGLGITVQKIGEATDALCSLEEGSLIGIRGPYGNGFTIPDDGSVERVIGVSGGVGAASTVMAMERAAGTGIHTVNLVGSRSANIMIYRERWEDISDSVRFSTDDGSFGHHGFVTDLLKEELGRMNREDLDTALVITCGPEAMMSAVHGILKEFGVKGQFSLERLMKCGLGVCDSCSASGKRVCQDGPVFGSDEIDLIEEFGKSHRDRAGRKRSLGECV